jgi:dinuclear metal center YbgI/SA1388 family protein
MAPEKKNSISDVLRALNQRAPLTTAEDWDNVGLLLGNPQDEVKGAVVSIDLTFEAVEFAQKTGANLIVNHHPCIFPKSRGLTNVTSGTPVFEAIKNGISVAAYHTNFDQCSFEVLQSVSQGLGLQLKGRLFEKSSHSLLKLVVFVPRSHLEQVRAAVFEAGAGRMGCYDSCGFSTEGEGTFRGDEGTQPFVGKPGKLETANEIRFETILPGGLKDVVVKAMLNAHPYEEVAYDLLAVEQTPSQEGLMFGLGYGFWGEFPSMKPFSEVAKDVKSLFDINGFWITNPAPTHVTKVGFVAGKGASFVDAEIADQCDLLITGEAGYHVALGGSRRGLAVMELGHRESEKFFIVTMKDWLSRLGLKVVEAQTPTQTIWLGGTK